MGYIIENIKYYHLLKPCIYYFNYLFIINLNYNVKIVYLIYKI